MAAITSPGIGSGLDVNSLVSQLVAADKQPLQGQIDSQRGSVQSQLSAIGTLKSLLSSMQTALSTLADGSVFGKRVAGSDSTSTFTASATSTAVAGSYAVEVDGLAAAQKLQSGAYAASDTVVGTGTLTLAVGGSSVAINIDSTNNTLAGIRDAINKASGNPGVSATIVNGSDGAHLVLTATKTGVANAFTVTAGGGDGGLAALGYDPGNGVNNLTVVTAAKDASLKIDGLAVTSATNTVTGAIDGVTLNLAAADVGNTHTLTVAQDTASITGTINAFVASYNAFVTGAKQLASYDAASGQSGPLLGDSTLLSISNQLAQRLGAVVGASGDTYRALGDIGISFQVDGTLKLDGTALNNALAANPAQVAGLFTGSGGYGASLNSLLDGYLDSNGILDSRTQSLNDRSKDLDDQQAALDARMSAEEAMYRAQFTALDTLLSSMKTTSSFLTQQLANMPLPGQSNK
ncbi:flagellar hook-associated protein 2 [Mizugakiibacter sediminis]|uniref:Flagellar hook-associated protein 2 n=1 Tax=Mizugakiibacter sediminis TaxID=1475481 RepID=A0A0K8QLF4_9GAMM|nr:flagellar filament capping protein FliD [Mizugakiibacter sediminis]GAP65252.1 flagellar hook-associated protein 2 [Mizugakiibacter sediminis]